MPKEVVYGDGPVFGPDSAATSILELTWSREAGHVQLRSGVVHASDHSDYVMSEKEAAEYGITQPEPFRSVYTQLSRDAINKLIRDLRRARDQAFGRDE